MIVYSKEQTIVFNQDLSKNILLIASAGSGKTFTITEWVSQMLLRTQFQPHEIILCTFTQAAGREMDTRLKDRLKELNYKNLKEKFYVDTFHSIGGSVLKKYKDVIMGNVLQHVSEGLTDFLHFLQDETDPNSLQFKKQIKLVIIDEYQDVNETQVNIANEFYKTGSRIVGVGDPNQEIYGFRGSDPKWIQTFPTTFSPCEICYLSTNYRSTQPIVELANSIVKQNRKTSFKIPEAVSSKQQDAADLLLCPLPCILNHRFSSEAYKDVVKKIQEILNNNKKGSSSSTHKYTPLHEINIQSRNSNLLFEIQAILVKMGIPCIVFSDTSKDSSRTKEQIKQCTIGKVVLSTIHAVKGLEYEYVFLLGLHRNYFPDAREIDIERERRLFYVAVTRAKRYLYIYNSFPNTSIFIYEIPSHLVRTGPSEYPKFYPSRKLLGCHCSLSPEDYIKRRKKNKNKRKKNLEGKEEEEEEEEDTENSASEAEETDRTDSDPESDFEEYYPDLKDRGKITSSSSSEGEDNEEKRKTKSRNKKIINIYTENLVRSLDGDQYTYMKNNLLPTTPVLWQILQTERNTSVEEEEEEEEKNTCSSLFSKTSNINMDGSTTTFLDLIKQEEEEGDNNKLRDILELRNDYDALNVRIPYFHSIYVRQNMLETEIQTFLEGASIRMIQEILYLQSSLSSTTSSSTTKKEIETYYKNEITEEFIRDFSSLSKKGKKPSSLPPECQSLILRHYKEYQNAKYSWKEILLPIFWTSICKNIKRGKKSILYTGITQEELEFYLPMMHEMYHQFKVLIHNESEVQFNHEIEINIPFYNLIYTNLLQQGNIKQEEAKTLCEKIQKKVKDKKIVLQGKIMVLSKNRIIICTHHPVSGFDMKDLLEGEDPALLSNQIQFPIVPVMEGLTLSAILACSNPLCNEPVPKQLIVYNAFARRICIVDLNSWNKQKEWIKYLCLHYCNQQESKRKTYNEICRKQQEEEEEEENV